MAPLLIALPHTGRVETSFMLSMMSLTQALGQAGIPFAVKAYQFSDIVMSRNFLMSFFVSNPEFERVLMLDTDLSFEPDQFFRLWDFDADFVAALYPFRRLDPERLAKAYEVDQANALPRSLDYVVATGTDPSGVHGSQIRDGFETVTSVGAGFLLLRRNVPDMMIQKGAARLLGRNGQGRGHTGAETFGDFFSHRLSDDGEMLFGEDESFCRRWRIECGGDIWADQKSQITHHGDFAFPGDVTAVGD